ncbi:Paraquat-inducible protein A [Arcobacter nitrofigilis DSM 7299]|uniref:Paraquat-inducible protein A n=1 Tax=Arcobacter nitrofigilis (strain ATCC 33309 / DSM 7299 / CCUG 15893 / LMG 7604 / NCTC 12251 / CI) TaxID=572480 RepID=D5V4K2_ARCNC|nr:paraquat-inducible protein A [Arcobacter nitrofigilis]ADG92907.1 Paraquat-inducible protein A [Arcobacter nitrofigilis DSM 7299]
MILISCKNCQKVYTKEDYSEFKCERCGHTVRRRVKNTIQTSLALVITSLLLFVLAMIYPMMEITEFGIKKESTIFQGVISFINYGDYFIAIVIFTASIIIPLVKLLVLLFIFVSLWIKTPFSNKTKLKLYHFIELIGKWSMIDIYVVAMLASTIHLGEIFNIKGGVAATAFACVVVLTMIAAHKFDTRIIWDERRKN